MPLTDHLLALVLATHPLGAATPLALNADAIGQPTGGAQIILTVGAGMTKHAGQAPLQTDAVRRPACKTTGKVTPTAKAMKCTPKAAAKHQA